MRALPPHPQDAGPPPQAETPWPPPPSVAGPPLPEEPLIITDTSSVKRDPSLAGELQRLSTAGITKSVMNTLNNRESVQAVIHLLGGAHPHNAASVKHHCIASDPEPELPSVARELTQSPRTAAHLDALPQGAGGKTPAPPLSPRSEVSELAPADFDVAPDGAEAGPTPAGVSVKPTNLSKWGDSDHEDLAPCGQHDVTRTPLCRGNHG